MGFQKVARREDIMVLMRGSGMAVAMGFAVIVISRLFTRARGAAGHRVNMTRVLPKGVRDETPA